MSKHKYITNYKTFQKELNAIQMFKSGSLKSRTITLEDVESLIIEIESKLDLFSYQKDRRGMVFKLNYHYQPRPMKNFKINSRATTVEIIKITEGWRVFNPKRDIIYSQRVIFLNPWDYMERFANYFNCNSFI